MLQVLVTICWIIKTFALYNIQQKPISMNPTAQKLYYPSLDGLRGIAILLVICCHNYNFLPYFSFGKVGVDLFFVLSGFLITDILLRTKNDKGFIQKFFLRRALRIFPLFYLSVLLYFLLTPFIAQFHIQYEYYSQHKEMVWLHLLNWLYIFHERPEHTLLFNHNWSLSLEEQFYLVWPFIILFIRNSKHLAVAIVALLCISILSRFTSWYILGNCDQNFLFQYMTRIDGLCIGSLAALWKFINPATVKRNISRLLLCILCFHGTVWITIRLANLQFPHYYIIGYTSISAIFGVVVWHAVESKNKVSAMLLQNTVLKKIGQVSYGLYMFHWPVLMICRAFISTKLLHAGLDNYTKNWIVATTAFAIATGLSFASYSLFEKRLLALKDTITTSGYFTLLRQRIFIFIRSVVTAK